MFTSQTQIKITIPSQMKDFLDGKANKFGLPTAAYIRHLILKDIEDMEYPTYQASKNTEKAYQEAIKEFDEGQLTSVENIDTFLKDL